MQQSEDPCSPGAARGIPVWLLLLAALTAIGPLSIDMYLPSLPSIAEDLGTGAGAIQLTLSAFLVGMALGQLAYGPLSDRFGRKPPIYFGLGIYILASVGCATAGSVEALIAWRFLQATGASAGIVIGRAVIRDRTDARGGAQALSLLMLVMGAAPILAPSIGGAMLTFVGWRGIFGLLAAVAALLLIGVHTTMQETLPRDQVAPLSPRRIAGDYGRLLRRRAFIQPALCGGLAFAGMFTYITGAPHVLIDVYGVPAQQFGLVFGLNAAGLIGASQINRQLLRRHSPETILGRAIWMLPVAGLVAAGPVWLGYSSLPTVMLGLFGFITTIGFVMPNAVALALAGTSDRAGAASALTGTLQFLLGTLSGLALGLWSSTGALPLTGTMFGFALATLLLHRATLARRPIHAVERRRTTPRTDTWTGTDADLGTSPATDAGPGVQRPNAKPRDACSEPGR